MNMPVDSSDPDPDGRMALGPGAFYEFARLVDAYGWARRVRVKSDDGTDVAGDIDREGRPSVGMRGYLRMAARHPGRAAVVVAELELLLEHGPEDEVIDALAEAGIADPAKLRPSDDVFPDEWFERMLPHLRAFVAAGETVPEAIPETSWEWRQRFDEISGLLGGGFYMYWQDDFADHDAVIDDYLSDGMDVAQATAMLADLRELRGICPGDDELEKPLRILGFHGRPPKGDTYNSWLDHVENRLRRYIAS